MPSSERSTTSLFQFPGAIIVSVQENINPGFITISAAMVKEKKEIVLSHSF
jgi:hypothetical protein